MQNLGNITISYYGDVDKMENKTENKMEKIVEKIIDTLGNCVLCRGMSDEDVRAFCESGMSAGTLRLRSINKDEYIFHEGASPRAMYILVSGRIGISRVTMSGRSILVEEIEECGDIFGEVYLFLGMPYKICTRALEDSDVISMSADIFSGLSGSDKPVGNVSDSSAYMYDYTMTRNMMSLLAQKAYMLSSRIQVLASPSIREKAARFILERELADGSVGADMSREAMADYMGVTRPSLSRELGKMQDEGLIRLDGRRIIVTDQDRLEMYL